MRNIYRILLLSVLACGAGAAHAENEVSYLSQIGISGRRWSSRTVRYNSRCRWT